MRDERGITLIELIIYAMLSILVLSVVGGMLINSFSAERVVRDSSDASNSGQLASQSITKGARMARALHVVTPSADSALLRVLIVDDALASPVVAHCEAWYFGDGELRTTRSSAAIAVPTTAADVADWTLLASRVEQVGTTPIFNVSGLSATLTMQLNTGEGSPVLIETTAVSRQPATPPTEVASLCF